MSMHNRLTSSDDHWPGFSVRWPVGKCMFESLLSSSLQSWITLNLTFWHLFLPFYKTRLEHIIWLDFTVLRTVHGYRLNHHDVRLDNCRLIFSKKKKKKKDCLFLLFSAITVTVKYILNMVVWLYCCAYLMYCVALVASLINQQWHPTISRTIATFR